MFCRKIKHPTTKRSSLALPACSFVSFPATFENFNSYSLSLGKAKQDLALGHDLIIDVHGSWALATEHSLFRLPLSGTSFLFTSDTAVLSHSSKLLLKTFCLLLPTLSYYNTFTGTGIGCPTKRWRRPKPMLPVSKPTSCISLPTTMPEWILQSWQSRRRLRF